MSGELVKYRPETASLQVRPRRRRGEPKATEPAGVSSSPRLSEEVRERLDAYVADVRKRNPAIAEFTDLMTASLEVVLIEQELRALREMRERLMFRWSY